MLALVVVKGTYHVAAAATLAEIAGAAVSNESPVAETDTAETLPPVEAALITVIAEEIVEAP
jgi:hypothetical protein